MPDQNLMADYKVKSSNPTQDEVRRMLEHCKMVYAQSTDTVWIDDSTPGVTTSLVQIFPKEDGTPGTQPTIKSVVQPTNTNDKIAMAEWKDDRARERKIQDHVTSRSVNISQMIIKTLSAGMSNILRKDQAGMNIMDNLSNPLAMILYIMSTDFSVGSQTIIDPIEKYFKARMYFDSNQVQQWSTETAITFSFRYKAEFSKVQFLAQQANIASELPGSVVLAYMFLGKLSSKYDPLRTEYEKTTRPKPKDIAGIIKDAMYWDTVTTVKPTYSPAQKAAYAVGIARAKQAHQNANNVPNTPPILGFKCRTHKTNDHAWKDAKCIAMMGKGKSA